MPTSVAGARSLDRDGKNPAGAAALSENLRRLERLTEDEQLQLGAALECGLVSFSVTADALGIPKCLSYRVALLRGLKEKFYGVRYDD